MVSVGRRARPPTLVDLLDVRDYVVGVKRDFGLVLCKARETFLWSLGQLRGPVLQSERLGDGVLQYQCLPERCRQISSSPGISFRFEADARPVSTKDVNDPPRFGGRRRRRFYLLGNRRALSRTVPGRGRRRRAAVSRPAAPRSNSPPLPAARQPAMPPQPAASQQCHLQHYFTLSITLIQAKALSCVTLCDTKVRWGEGHLPVFWGPKYVVRKLRLW